MKKNAILLVMALWVSSLTFALDFDKYFIDKTLRVDYIFSGNANEQHICVNELVQLPQWAGRRHNLDRLPLKGNGQIEMKDVVSGKCIYRTSFSALFLEWISTDEAKHIDKGFENSFLLPFPKAVTEITITLCNAKQEPKATLTHLINPKDILIRELGEKNVTPHTYLHHGGSYQSCIDVVIMAEGYQHNEMETFYEDARIASESLFNHEPFASLKDRFNIIAVACESQDSGVTVPRKGQWKRTAINSNFDTFYSDRYLTTTHIKDVHNLLAGIPYEHIIILANTEEYGGGGIYNSYTLTTAHHPDFKPVVVHEFGHSFGGLADEYFYEEDVLNGVYDLNIEPWEPNITTLKDFNGKWENLLKRKSPVPTSTTEKDKFPIGVYEGGGYSFKGIYRPAFDCRMKTNECEGFCLGCQHALKKLIDFYTKQ